VDRPWESCLALCRKLQRGAAVSDDGKPGKLHDLVMRTKSGELHHEARWYLTDKIRNFGVS